MCHRRFSCQFRTGNLWRNSSVGLKREPSAAWPLHGMMATLPGKRGSPSPRRVSGLDALASLDSPAATGRPIPPHDLGALVLLRLRAVSPTWRLLISARLAPGL